MNTTARLGERTYESLYNILKAWRRSGGPNDTLTGAFSRYDTPGTFYFRIFFDFTKGLLGGTDDTIKGTRPSDQFLDDRGRTTFNNTALNYLLLNNEWERADALRDFITLLSNINVNSPWYFSQIEGLTDVLSRTEFTAETFAIPEQKGITIKCLPDAYDNRIGTLLDLYREICYSWQLHKEVVPANLRRFDMSIYIFSTPIQGIHSLHDRSSLELNIKGGSLGFINEPTGFASYDQNDISVDNTTAKPTLKGNKYLTSSKLIQLMDCEIDLNGSTTGYGTLDNKEGFIQEYTIPIKVGYAMEQRYNEILLKRIGDYVVGDMDLPGSNDENKGNTRPTIYNEENASEALTINPNHGGRITRGDVIGTNSLVNNISNTLNSWLDVDNVAGALTEAAQRQLEKLYLGNIQKINVHDVASKVNSFVNSLSADNVINRGSDKVYNATNKGVEKLGNLAEGYAEKRGWTHTTDKDLGTLRTSKGNTLSNISRKEK